LPCCFFNWISLPVDVEFPLAMLVLVTDDVGDVGTRTSLSDEFFELRRNDEVFVRVALEMHGMDLFDFIVDEVFDEKGE